MIRSEVATLAHRFREAIFAGVAIVLALFVASMGGYLLAPLGLGLAALAACWGLIAIRRARFMRPIDAAGLVEVDEGRIGYFGAGQGLGGYIEIDDLSEIRLIPIRAAAHWRLKSISGQAIVIPVSATHAERLYDAFARLPGIDMAAVTNALNTSAQSSNIIAQSLWVRSKAAPLDTPRLTRHL
jgi:hypothetical protein